MSYILDDLVDDPPLTDDSYMGIDLNASHIILLTEPPTEHTNTYILQSTPISLETVPITLTTSEVPEPTEPKNVRPLYNCKFCKYTTSRLTYFDKHQETHWVVKKKTKNATKKKADAKNAANKNIAITITETNDSTEYKCPHCSYYTSNIRSLRIHMHIHSNGKAYTCKDCNFKGKNLEELIQHHKRLKMLSCKYCTFSTHNKELFKAHKEDQHMAKWFGCTKCKFAAADRSYIIKHMKEQHGNALRFDPVQMEPEDEAEAPNPTVESVVF